jgi:flavin-dependent dehydrogenase
MQNCEVLIVGGGPAGSSCAGRLVQAGLDVLVIDRKTFPRDKTCAGWVTPQVFDVLGVDAADYANSHVCQPITGFRTGMIGGDEIGTEYGRIVSYGIRRCEFDHFLLERSGAPCRFGETVHDLRRDGSGWIVNDSIRAQVLIGAGGHF